MSSDCSKPEQDIVHLIMSLEMFKQLIENGTEFLGSEEFHTLWEAQQFRKAVEDA